MDRLNQTFVHYGQEFFDIGRWRSVTNNIGWNKPKGGLWCTPETSPNDWASWCREENWHVGHLEKSFKVFIKPTAEILIIDNIKTLEIVQRQNYMEGINRILPDFEILKKYYDGIFFDLSSDQRLYMELYGWDCDSLLIMNPYRFKYSQQLM